MTRRDLIALGLRLSGVAAGLFSLRGRGPRKRTPRAATQGRGDPVLMVGGVGFTPLPTGVIVVSAGRIEVGDAPPLAVGDVVFRPRAIGGEHAGWDVAIGRMSGPPAAIADFLRHCYRPVRTAALLRVDTADAGDLHIDLGRLDYISARFVGDPAGVLVNVRFFLPRVAIT